MTTYKNYYKKIYPLHSVHASIVNGENAGLQMAGGNYHVYNAFNLSGDTVSSADYIEPGKLTLVICWATWCVPCRKEAMEIIPLYRQYHDKGLNAISLAREFGSMDAVKRVTEEDRHPWPTLIDIDDKFGIFPKHGVSSSGLFLIDTDGRIVTATYFIDDIKKELEKRL